MKPESLHFMATRFKSKLETGYRSMSLTYMELLLVVCFPHRLFEYPNLLSGMTCSSLHWSTLVCFTIAFVSVDVALPVA